MVDKDFFKILNLMLNLIKAVLYMFYFTLMFRTSFWVQRKQVVWMLGSQQNIQISSIEWKIIDPFFCARDTRCSLT